MDQTSKKRQLEREDALFEIEMAERKERLSQMKAETKVMMAEAEVKIAEAQFKTAAAQYKLMINSQGALSSSAGSAGSQLEIENDAETDPETGEKLITVMDVAKDMGIDLSVEELLEVDKLCAEKHRQKYGKEPKKSRKKVLISKDSQ
jgi:hypothetical protein